MVRSPNWIGDCIMCLPALRFLAFRWPGANVYLAAKKSLCPIYENIPHIAGIIPLPDNFDFKSMFTTAHRLGSYGFDYGILFANSFQSALLFKLAGIKKLIGCGKDMRGWMLSEKIKFHRDNNHQIFFYLDIITHFLKFVAKTAEGSFPGSEGFLADGANSSGMELIISRSERESLSAVLSGLGIDGRLPLVGISPFAAFGSAKEWPPERFSELIRRLREIPPLTGAEILLFGSPQEKEKLSLIMKSADTGGIHNLAGKSTLRQSLVTLSSCCLFIGNDSGLMHAASALKVPLVALFGPTPLQKSRPLPENARTLHHPVKCAPCRHRVCPLDHDNHACMKAITVEEVLETAVSLLRQYPPPRTPRRLNDLT